MKRAMTIRTVTAAAGLALLLAGCTGSADAPGTDATPVAGPSSTSAPTDTAVPTDPPTASPTPTPPPDEAASPSVTPSAGATTPPPATAPVPHVSGAVPEGSGCSPGTPDSLPDGRWFGFLVAESAEDLQLDLACWFSGEQALIVARDREGPDAEVPNDYLIVNDNPRLRTLPVAADATAVRIVGNDASVTETVSWAELMADHGSFADDCPGTWCLAWFTVRDGAVVEVEMQFVP